jgi:hypothetical protein
VCYTQKNQQVSTMAHRLPLLVSSLLAACTPADPKPGAPPVEEDPSLPPDTGAVDADGDGVAVGADCDDDDPLQQEPAVVERLSIDLTRNRDWCSPCTRLHVFGDVDLDLDDTELAALSCLERVGGNLVLRGPAANSATLSGLQRVGGRFVQMGGMRDLSGMTALQSVGELSLRGGEGDRLVGPPALEVVEGTWELEMYEGPTEVAGFESLSTVGSLKMVILPHLEQLSLPALRDVRGDFQLYVTNLSTLEGLGALERIAGDAWIGENPLLPGAEVERFQQQVTVGGSFSAENNGL